MRMYPLTAGGLLAPVPPARPKAAAALAWKPGSSAWAAMSSLNISPSFAAAPSPACTSCRGCTFSTSAHTPSSFGPTPARARRRSRAPPRRQAPRLLWVVTVGPEPIVGDHVEERPLELCIVPRHALERSLQPAQRGLVLLRLVGLARPRRDAELSALRRVLLRVAGGGQAVVRVRRVWRVELPDGLGRLLGRKRHPVLVDALGLGIVVLVGRRQRELPALHRRVEPRPEAAAAVACPPLLHCDGTVPVDVEPLEARAPRPPRGRHCHRRRRARSAAPPD
eukprot:scaffold47652_cov67-Phaeocystis_antarctica.AAC.1